MLMVIDCYNLPVHSMYCDMIINNRKIIIQDHIIFSGKNVRKKYMNKQKYFKKINV
jgi:hypothetical protein